MQPSKGVKPGRPAKAAGAEMKGVGPIGRPLYFLVRQEGLEPPTGGLEGHCSIHLSYWRVFRLF